MPRQSKLHDRTIGFFETLLDRPGLENRIQRCRLAIPGIFSMTLVPFCLYMFLGEAELRGTIGAR
jgi:hypothetical protein